MLRTIPFLVCLVLSGQIRDKRVTPVDVSAKQTFDKQVKVALLVGVGNYSRASGLPPLKYPSRDVALLTTELEKQGYLVRKLIDADATRGVVKRALNELGGALDRDQGTFLFYFSGHGFQQNGRNYLATFGSTADDLKDEGLPVGDVEAILKSSRAKQSMMFIDACRDDPAAGARSVGSRSFAALSASQGLRALYSTREGHVSYESDDLQQGVFTHFLIRGLRGEAAGSDGLVTFRDLTDYLIDQVRAFGIRTGSVQVPYEAGESSGDFLLARTTANVSTPISTPPISTTPISTLPATTRPIMVGSVDVSHFAGLQQGDPMQKAITLFGAQSEDSNTAMMVFKGGGLYLADVWLYGSNTVRGVTVLEAGADFVRSHAAADPLLDLIGKPQASVTAALGSPSISPAEGTDGWYHPVWNLPQGGNLIVNLERGVCKYITVNWVAPGGPPAANAAARAVTVGRIDVSHFGGIRPGDTEQRVDSIYAKPVQTYGTRHVHGDPNGSPGLWVDYEANAVNSVQVFDNELAWVRARGGNDALLNLIGQSEEAAIAILGPPTRRERGANDANFQYLYWSFSVNGEPLSQSPNSSTRGTLTLSFLRGANCHFVGVHW